MAHTFNGTSDHISLSLGRLNFVFGPGTLAAVIQVGSNATDNDFFCIGSGVDIAFFIPSANTFLSVFLGTGGTDAAIPVTPADGWVLVAVTKATGTVAPRFYKYRYDTGAWTIANGGTLANSPTPDVSAEFGQDVGGGSNFNGQLEIVGAWDSVLSDTQIQALPYRIKPWLTQVNPRGLWTFEEAVAVPVIDWTAGGANQSAISGTSLYTGAVPPWDFTFDPGPLDLAGVSSSP